MAQLRPDSAAVIECRGHAVPQARRYRHFAFRDLDGDSDALAAGLMQLGVQQGTPLALMVRPSFDFISLVFGMFKCGAVPILIDPGMGRRNVLRCLEEVQPQGFIALPQVHVVRRLLGRRFSQARLNVVVGRLRIWGGVTLAALRSAGTKARSTVQLPTTTAEDPAAIIFTTGSTGPPKGVLYVHGNFDTQVDELRDAYGIQLGEIDVACFPLFALFNAGLGVTTVVPRMDFSRPAQADPRNIIGPINDLAATQAFASPAVWWRVGQYCQVHGIKLPTLRRVLSAGAPVPLRVLELMRECIHPQGDIHTPYGATEALPVASIAASEVLADTAAPTRAGQGVCVGRKFPHIEWKVVPMVDGPITSPLGARALPSGQIGELIVTGPVVTREYVNRPQANALGKIADGARIWHRMGDVGYFDERGRFWFCGRMAHRVTTPGGTLFTIPCEALFNNHPDVFRSALVGVGPPGQQRPVLIVEPKPGRFPRTDAARRRIIEELRQIAASDPRTAAIGDFLFHPRLPVDIRHNVKIFREKLAVWAAEVLHKEAGG
jgi:acyl-CoA synthetase (AMP-forming)/AMP-acid ligase II